jgi:hypothetical protein
MGVAAKRPWRGTGKGTPMTNRGAALDAVFVDVAAECYDRVQKLTGLGDGLEAEAAERAIEMALFGNRPAKEPCLLLGDVLKNARFSVRRSRARNAVATDELRRLGQQKVATGGCRGFITDETPEDLVIARELGRCLHGEACRCGTYGVRVLEGVIGGESAQETAAAAGVSRATVDRTLRRLRKAAIAAGYREAA